MDDRNDLRRLAEEIGRSFAEHVQLEDLFRFAADRCRELLDAEVVAVWLVDAERSELYCVQVTEHGPAVAGDLGVRRLPTDQGIAGTVLRTRRSVQVDHASADPRFVNAVDQPTAHAARALLCAPLASPQGVIGVIEAVNVLGAAVFDDEDRALLETLAEHLAAAIRNSQSAVAVPAVGGQQSAPQGEQPATVFRREGDYWTIVFAGRVARLKDAKGLHYIAYLLRHPGREFHVSELIAAIGDAGPDLSTETRAEPIGRDARASDAIHERGLSDAGPVLDAKAKAEYKRRIDDLRSELEEAERFNDPGRAARAREEIEAISEQLTAAVGLGGRDRVAASDAERARLAVTKRIKAALAKIRDANPVLAQHLGAAITTGYFCSYAPKADTPTSWSLE